GAVGVRLRAVLRLGTPRPAEGQGGLRLRPGREDQPVLPRPAAPLPHLPGKGRDPGGQAARQDPIDPEDAVGRNHSRRGQVNCRPEGGVTVGVLSLLLVAAAAQPDDGLAKKMLPIYVKEAETYSIAVESAPKKTLELKKEPVFDWLNVARGD